MILLAHAFTHHVHVIIDLPHSVLKFKCFSMEILRRFNPPIHVFTHCLQVPHF